MLTASQDKSHPTATTIMTPPLSSETPQLPTPTQEPYPSADVRITIPTNNIAASSISNEEKYRKQACYLRKICALLASTSIWVVLALDEADLSKRCESLFLIICCFVAYITFENIFLCLVQELPDDHCHDYLFEVFDGILILYFLMVLMFCDQEEHTLGQYLMLVSPCLHLVLTCIYAKQLGRESSVLKKSSEMLRRILCNIQLWGLTAKILGYITLDWMTIFMPLGFILLGYQIYGSYILIKTAIQLLNESETSTASFVKRCIQISWSLLHCGFYPLSLAIMLNLCQAAEHVENEEFIVVLLTIAKYYCSFLLGYTLVFFKLMKKFDINLRLEGDHEEVGMKVKIQNKAEPVKEGTISFFQRMSPTFFVKVESVESESGKDNAKPQEEEEMNDTRSTGTEEFLCYICETNNPDVILVDCGHGGMCKDCLFLSMKKNNNCLQCRRPVRSIYQITKEEMKTGVVEAVETFSIV